VIPERTFPRSLPAVVAAVWGLLAQAPTFGAEPGSICYGTVKRGGLEGGVPLPVSGPNFRSFSEEASKMGRTHVHRTVRDALVEAYEQLAGSNPETLWIYGETGWPKGGKFTPHKTHQNGTSVDFLVPVRDREGRPAALPTDVTNLFGYSLEFDRDGRHGGLAIDFPAVCAHLLRLREAAARRGIPLRRVIFAPEFVSKLRGTADCDRARTTIPWLTKRSWIRHDEHYHVDFAVPCRPYAR